MADEMGAPDEMNEGAMALRLVAQRLGLTNAAKVSRRLGCSQAYAWQLLHGRRKPGRAFAQKLAHSPWCVPMAAWDVAIKEAPSADGAVGETPSLTGS